MTTHVLIGAGPGSMAAAEAIRAQDATAQIAVVSTEAEGYYSRPGLAYYVANEEPEKRLFPFSAKDIRDLGVSMVLARVTDIHPAEHRVDLQDGRTLRYDRLLIATGSLAVPLPVPGAQLDGVIKLDNIADARDLIARGTRAKEAVVVGGGITALEIVEGLRARGVHVHYLMRKERYWGNVLSEYESRVVERGLYDRGVVIHYFTELAEVLGRGGRVVAISTEKGEQLPCDMVAAAIGVRPQKQLAEQAGLECDRGVLVDRHLCSSHPDIYAAGDVAEAADETGKRAIEVLWSSAASKGRVAGHNMATGSGLVYQKGAPLNVTRLAGFKITIIGTVGSGHDSDLAGVARGDSETWRRLGPSLSAEWHAGDTHVRLQLAGDVMVGAVVMGDQALSFPLQDLIAAGVNVSGISERLSAPRAPVPDIINECWREWQVRHVQ